MQATQHSNSPAQSGESSLMASKVATHEDPIEAFYRSCLETLCEISDLAKAAREWQKGQISDEAFRGMLIKAEWNGTGWAIYQATGFNFGRVWDAIKART